MLLYILISVFSFGFGYFVGSNNPTSSIRAKIKDAAVKAANKI